MLLLYWYSVSFLACLLQVSATILTPLNDIQVCTASSLSSEQIISLLCNVTERNAFISWKITVNGLSTNINFDSTSHLDSNRYWRTPGIEVSLISRSNYHLTSVAKIRIPPFDVVRYSTKLSCNRITRSILPAAVPDPPHNISIKFSNYQENDNFTATLMWSSSTINDQSYIKNSYSIIIYPKPNNAVNGSIMTTAQSQLLVLHKNISYNVSIKQSNCAGISQIRQTTISLLNYLLETTFCATPLPLNGQVMNYTSNSVYSILKYQCEEGFFPQLQMISHCNINGRWEPDPSEHNCSLAEVTTGKGNATTAVMSVQTKTISIKSIRNDVNDSIFSMDVRFYNDMSHTYIHGLSGFLIMIIIGVILFSVTILVIRRKRIRERRSVICNSTNFQAVVAENNRNYKDNESHRNTEGRLSPFIMQNESYNFVGKENTENIYEAVL